jgi:hypothetical protein
MADHEHEEAADSSSVKENRDSAGDFSDRENVRILPQIPPARLSATSTRPAFQYHPELC